MTFFPSVPGVIQATSRRVSGALVKNDRSKPSKEGILVALHAEVKDKDPEKSKRVMAAMLQMDKIDIKTLRQAYEQQ